MPGSFLVYVFQLAALGYLATAARLPFDLKDKAVAVSDRRATDRRLQDTVEDVCYEGCFAVPPADPYAAPLPIQLFRSEDRASVMMLPDCFLLAAAANLTYFAVYDQYDCYGGNEPLEGWDREECPVNCLPDSATAGPCGGRSKASLFSMGVCSTADVPCDPSPPPLAPPPPSPAKSFRCKPGIALWGTPLPGSPVKLSNKGSTAANTAECQRRCAQDPGCKGYYYKTTTWCYMLSDVEAWGKKYSTAVQACKVV